MGLRSVDSEKPDKVLVFDEAGRATLEGIVDTTPVPTGLHLKLTGNKLLVRWPAATDRAEEGSWYWLASRQHLKTAVDADLFLISRPASASPAVGYYAKHNAQQKAVIEGAFGALVKQRNNSQE